MNVRVTPPIDSVGGSTPPAEDSEGPGGRVDGLRELFRSTPAKLISLGLVLAVLLVVSGLASAQVAGSRKATHDRLLATTEPLANAAQNLYSALSIADAAAVTGFISGGIEPAEVRDRYVEAIAEASGELVVAAAGLAEEDEFGAANIAAIARLLPMYTGLIETARANNRTGNPVGAAYLTEASNMMQTSMLPVAQELHTQGETAVNSTQRAAVAPPWSAIGLLLVTVAALCAAHVLISRKTRRTFNPGLIIAIGATGALLCWLLIAGLVSSNATERAIEQGAEPLADLTESRILAQQSRTAETLLLARRDVTGMYTGAFDETITRLGDLLEQYTSNGAVEIGTDAVDQAEVARTAWINSHARTVAALERGDYTAAAVLATGPGPDEATAQFARLDTALGEGIEQTRNELRDNEFRASRTLSGLAPVAIALMVLSLISVIIGLWPRLREYQ
ncbi:hypothetical protein [Rhodococcus sp. SMB37]|uniref:hypothetical protein n=1 Tax=Rhodococcus sp. SMB37 TaxID=2512213 RepID=UPI001044E0AD|nr:hypothetical protein [Rhodococcus sp. SMB37]